MQGHSPVSQPPPPIPDPLFLNHPPESTTQPTVPIMASEVLDILYVESLSSALPLQNLSVDQILKLSALLLQAQISSDKTPFSSRSYASLLSQPSLALPQSLLPTSWIDGFISKATSVHLL